MTSRVSRPILYLGDKPIGHIDDFTYEKPSSFAHWWNVTEFYDLGLKLETVWWKDWPREPSTAWSCIGDGRAANVWKRDYPMPVSRGGLEEAHNYLVQQVREGKLP